MTSTGLVFPGAGIGGAPRHGANPVSPRWLLGGFAAFPAFSLDAGLPWDRDEAALTGRVSGSVMVSLVGGFAVMRGLS